MTTTDLTEIFGPVISRYTRAQALEDGELVDLTEWGSSKPGGMMGGFTVPVAVTRALWAAIEALPPAAGASVRGRAHDVLWMGSLAARAAGRADREDAYYKLHLPRKGTRKRLVTLRINIGPGDEGEPVITIGFPEDF